MGTSSTVMVRDTRATALGVAGFAVAVRVLAAAEGIALIHVGGFLQLAGLTGSAERAIALGATPFLALDLLKVLAAAALSPTTPRATA